MMIRWKGRRVAVHVLFGWFAPRWRRYVIEHPRRTTEYTTLRAGVVQVKVTRNALRASGQPEAVSRDA